MGRTCSAHGNSMNNLLSYCGLVDARISASEKALPVPGNSINYNSAVNQKLLDELSNRYLLHGMFNSTY